ncbi:MAG: hypothetical protein LBC84_09610 [Prevotellaceae bacterium]|jgi:hypothetical protein|nr:hypothetical protein [Prevotellaceae bacterium]
MNKIFFTAALLLLLAASCGGRQQSESKLSNSTQPKEILSVFKKVLTNQITHTDAESKRKIFLKDYCDENGISEIDLRFAVVDLDGDGIPEIVFEHDPGIVRVLRYEKGLIFGFTFDYRAMNDIKKDGTFEWSNSAFHSGIGRQTFYGTETYMVFVAEGRWPGSDTFEEGFSIHGSTVTEQQFGAFSSARWKKEEVEWKQFSIENVNNLKAWGDYEFFYSTIPDSMFPIPKRGGGVIPYDHYSPPQDGDVGTCYGFENADWIESYKTQLRKAGFEEQEGAPEWMESLWRYNRSADGASLIVELLLEENLFSIQMYINFL